MSLLGSFFTGRRSYGQYEPEPHYKNNPNSNWSVAPIITETTPAVNSKIHWEETPTEHIFRIDLPGFKKEEVTVSVEDMVLKITGEKCVEKVDRTDPWNRIERVHGRFVRSLWLPTDCKPHRADACMENGKVTIRVPKQEMVNTHGNSTHLPLR